MQPLPTQLSGAKFLADRQFALLADSPRVGKTGAAIIAADYIFASKILVVTTASGRPVWRRAFDQWSDFGRSIRIISNSVGNTDGVSIIGWSSIADPKIRSVLMKADFDLVILDESHNAKSIDTKRTAAAYGDMIEDGKHRVARNAIIANAKNVWCLTGTPIPHTPNDLYPMMRALCPERLLTLPDVSLYQDFLHRYCVVRMKKLPRGFRKIPVVIAGRNEAELGARLEGFILRRTQEDIGIRAPIYETLPLMVSDRMRAQADGNLDRKTILAAAEAGSTREIEMHLGPLRRLTGEIKAHAVVEAVKEEFDGGLDKIVLMYWHKDVGQILRAGLDKYGVIGIDGSTPPEARGAIEQQFLNDKSKRVFLGQIVAAGEAIDLSAAATLWFVETSFTPKDMAQAALRITNVTQTRQAIVRVCVLEGSIDEALQASLMRLWTAIREVLSHARN